jgi:hypothetical protein
MESRDDRGIGPSDHQVIQEPLHAQPMDRWADGPISRFWSRLRPNIALLVHFLPKCAIDFRSFLTSLWVLAQLSFRFGTPEKHIREPPQRGDFANRQSAIDNRKSVMLSSEFCPAKFVDWTGSDQPWREPARELDGNSK